MSVTIKLRRGTSLEWTNSSPNIVLSLGEPGFETDTHKLKIGDGTTAWNSLDYVSGGFSGAGGPLDYTYAVSYSANTFIANYDANDVINNLQINPTSHDIDFSAYYDDLIDNSYAINITLTQVEDADKAILFSCNNIVDLTSTPPYPYYSFDVIELSRSASFTGFENTKKYYLNIDIKGQNFPELTEDRIDSLIVATGGISKNYDDAANPATLTLSIDPAFLNTSLVAGSGISLDYANDELTVSASGVFQIASVDLHNGGVVTAQVLQFNDDSQQSVITGPTPPSGNSSQRIIIQGQRAQGGGEGGDVYVWGGDSDANGGDIKIYAGDADNVSPDSGYGGYVNIDGGKGASGGGDVEITGGYSAGGQAGDVIIAGGTTVSGVAGVVNINSNNGNWVFGAGGGLTLPQGGIITDDIETVTLSGAGTVGVNQTYRKVAAGVYVETTNYLYQIEPREAPSTGYQVRLTTLSPPGYYESEDLITWTIVSGENGGVSPVPTGVVVPPNITLSVDSSGWTFGGDGSLTFPDGSIQTTAPTVIDVVQGSGVSVTSSSGTFTVGVSGLNASYISDFSSAVSGVMFGIDGSLILPGSGGITFPDNSIQTTAYGGFLPVTDVVEGSGIHVSSSSGTFTVSASGLDASYISDFDESVDDRVGDLLIAGDNISLDYVDASGTLTISAVNDIAINSQEPNGFINRLDSTISTSGNIFSISPTGSSYSVYIQGVKFTKTVTENVTIPSGVTGASYIHFNIDTGDLDNKTTPFNFSTDIPVAYVVWNSTSQSVIYLGDERHGIQMDSATHRYLHNTQGTQYISGLSISDYVLDGNGSSNSHASIGISAGILYDEDIEINIVNGAGGEPFHQVLSPSGSIPVYYHDGAAGSWAINTNTYPLKYSINGAQYNKLNGTWAAVDATTNATTTYVSMFLCASNNIHAPVFAIMGQGVHPNLNDAQNDDTWESLDITYLPANEMKPLYRLVYATDRDWTNTPKSSLVAILDLRSQALVMGGLTQNDHGSLYGLADDDHFQYVHIDNARTISANHTFTNGLTASGTISAASGTFTSLTVNSTGVSLSGHSHTASNISDFNSSVNDRVGDLLVAGDNISLEYINSPASLTVSIVPTFLNTSLVSGSGISLSYANSELTVRVSGLNASYISDFSSSVSGLLPVKSVVQGSGVSVTSSSGVFTVGASGLNASYISDFSSSVSGLLPVKNIVQGSGVSVISSSGTFTISANGTTGSPDAGFINKLQLATTAPTVVSTTLNYTGPSAVGFQSKYLNFTSPPTSGLNGKWKYERLPGVYNLFTGVTISGTGGQFSCNALNGGFLRVGQQLTISGTLAGTGTITGYANPTIYLIGATNGATTFTLTTVTGAAIVTTTGTPTGLTYTLKDYLATNVAVTDTSGGLSCAITALRVGQTLRVAGTSSGTGSIAAGDYFISETNGSTTFRVINQNTGFTPVTTVAGTTTGLTFSIFDRMNFSSFNPYYPTIITGEVIADYADAPKIKKKNLKTLWAVITPHHTMTMTAGSLLGYLYFNLYTFDNATGSPLTYTNRFDYMCTKAVENFSNAGDVYLQGGHKYLIYAKDSSKYLANMADSTTPTYAGSTFPSQLTTEMLKDPYDMYTDIPHIPFVYHTVKSPTINIIRITGTDGTFNCNPLYIAGGTTSYLANGQLVMILGAFANGIIVSPPFTAGNLYIIDGTPTTEANGTVTFKLKTLVGDPLVTSLTTTTLSSVVLTGTAGQFSCASSFLKVGQTVTISGTLGGTGSITGYSSPTTYVIGVTNGTTTGTLFTTAGAAIATTAGTPTGLTYTSGHAGTAALAFYVNPPDPNNTYVSQMTLSTSTTNPGIPLGITVDSMGYSGTADDSSEVNVKLDLVY